MVQLFPTQGCGGIYNDIILNITGLFEKRNTRVSYEFVMAIARVESLSWTSFTSFTNKQEITRYRQRVFLFIDT